MIIIIMMMIIIIIIITIIIIIIELNEYYFIKEIYQLKEKEYLFPENRKTAVL